MADTVRIPDEIKPADGRFGCGPGKVRPEAVRALADVATTYLGTSHRQKTVRDQVARLRRGLAELLGAPDGYEVILSNGGTTAFWDAATFGLIRDRAQFATFGEFGAKFAKAAKDAPFLGEPTVRKAEPGTAATPGRRGRRRRVRHPAQRDIDRRHRAGAAGRRRRRGRAPAHRRHVGRRRGRGRPEPDRRLLLRAAEGARLRRWSLARA